ncbi:hypothetical protein [Brevibacterium spongiae]|uniref:Nuclear transport factor 2 family protein n=1 Tax=Brevibacterium spongiae TaxID=2909672 RepID=A0ABY5SWY6_9MICO|nr:hypothetical protein [Brevibacterium spongiae]UVI37551.1 hypothetical protein L1F31_07855 [Brevibacterium spongiae]
MRTGTTRTCRRPTLLLSALCTALSLITLAGCADSSPVAVPTSTLPEQQPDTGSMGDAGEVDIPEYETDLDLTDDEKKAVDGALVALDGYVANLNQAYSSGGTKTDKIRDFSTGEALKVLVADSKELKQSDKYMAGKFTIDDRTIQKIDSNLDEVTILTCVDNSQFATVDNGESLPTGSPELLRVVFMAQRTEEVWKIDSQSLWSESCDE